MLDTVHYLNQLDIQGIKLELLHILEGTVLAEEYKRQKITVLSQEEYVCLLLDCITHLSPQTVMHPLTGDGAKELLLAPSWSRNKRTVLNEISHQMKVLDIYQGKHFIPN